MNLKMSGSFNTRFLGIKRYKGRLYTIFPAYVALDLQPISCFPRNCNVANLLETEGFTSSCSS